MRQPRRCRRSADQVQTNNSNLRQVQQDYSSITNVLSQVQSTVSALPKVLSVQPQKVLSRVKRQGVQTDSHLDFSLNSNLLPWISSSALSSFLLPSFVYSHDLFTIFSRNLLTICSQSTLTICSQSTHTIYSHNLLTIYSHNLLSQSAQGLRDERELAVREQCFVSTIGTKESPSRRCVFPFEYKVSSFKYSSDEVFQNAGQTRMFIHKGPCQNYLAENHFAKKTLAERGSPLNSAKKKVR